MDIGGGKIFLLEDCQYMKNIAIITARGGSKRIPKKNLKEFCGKPIIAYSIAAALESGLFEEVMVSTDSLDIADIAKKYGAEVPFLRSSVNSDDYATTSEVLREVLEEYERRNRIFRWVCCLYPTAPMISSDNLKAAFRKLQETRGDALTSVVQFSYPPQRCFFMKDGYLFRKWSKYENARSQDLEPLYHDAGQFYFWDVKKFLNGNISNMLPFVLKEMEVQDIDNIEDWEIAEMKYRLLKRNVE